MKALRIHVERIVRPIRGSVPRKNKMREELLAHLTAAYDDERPNANTEKDAIERAKQRLGDPQALRAELQSAVPWYERLGHTRIPMRMQIFDYERCTTYGWRASARFATEIIICLVVSSPVLFALGRHVSHNGLHRPVAAAHACSPLTIAGFLACLWVSLFVTFWLGDSIGVRKRLAPWSKTPALIKATLATLNWMVAIVLFLTLATRFGDLVQPPSGPDSTATILLAAFSAIPYAPWMGLIFVVGLILFTAVTMNFERRQYENWASLDIEADPE